jgi:hypothetical protein
MRSELNELNIRMVTGCNGVADVDMNDRKLELGGS